jgi:hypothetical protein
LKFAKSLIGEAEEFFPVGMVAESGGILKEIAQVLQGVDEDCHLDLSIFFEGGSGDRSDAMNHRCEGFFDFGVLEWDFIEDFFGCFEEGRGRKNGDLFLLVLYPF